jgi:hypothetical protein
VAFVRIGVLVKAADIIQSVIGGLAVILLAAIGRGVLGLGKDFRRFMTEHIWLITTTLWTRDKVRQIMTKLDMPMTELPPDDLPWKVK